MSGRVYQFGNTPLPSAAAKWNVSAPAQKNVVKTLGGPFDPQRGDRCAIDLPQPITVSALAFAASQSALGATLDDYRAMLGARERLWLKPHDTTQVDRWCWARLVEINETGSVYNRITQPVDLVFQNVSGWNGHAYGGGWNLDSGYYFDSGLYLDSGGGQYVESGSNVSLTNAGNRIVTNLGITVLFGIATQSIVFTVPSLAQFSFVRDIDAGSTLTIDCGSQTVLLDGAAVYGNFTLGPNQYVADWLPLLPGATSVNIVTDVDNPIMPYVTFTYSDGWV